MYPNSLDFCVSITKGVGGVFSEAFSIGGLQSEIDCEVLLSNGNFCGDKFSRVCSSRSM